MEVNWGGEVEEMGGNELYEGLKKAVGEIEEGGVTAYGLSSAYLYGLAVIPVGSVPAELREEFEGIRAEYAGADPSSEIDDSLVANSMLMLDEGELERLAKRIRGLFGRVAKDSGK
jgi:hypothetical protein